LKRASIPDFNQSSLHWIARDAAQFLNEFGVSVDVEVVIMRLPERTLTEGLKFVDFAGFIGTTALVS